MAHLKRIKKSFYDLGKNEKFFFSNLDIEDDGAMFISVRDGLVTYQYHPHGCKYTHGLSSNSNVCFVNMPTEFEKLSNRQQRIARSFNIAALAERLGYGESDVSLRNSQLTKMIEAAHPFSDWTSPASSEIEAMKNDVAIVDNYLKTQAAKYYD